ncbi:MAG: calcium-binding protein [Acidimicrobiales bacterium]
MHRSGRSTALAAVAGLLMAMLVAAPAPALDGGTTCNTFGGDGFQSVNIEIGDGDTRTVIRYRNGRVLVDGTNCGRVLGRGTVDILDSGEASTNTIVVDASTRWSTGGEFTIPFSTNLRGHIQDGRPDRVIVNGSTGRDVVTLFGDDLIIRRGGRAMFSMSFERTTVAVVNLGRGNDRFESADTVSDDAPAALTIKGGGGRDVIIGNALGERLIGGPGNDRLVGKAGADVLRGGPGDDRLVPGAGADRVDGGGGTDTCACNAGDTVTNVP